MSLNYPMAIKYSSTICSVMSRRPLSKHQNALSDCGSVKSDACDVILPTYTLMFTDSQSHNNMTTIPMTYS